MSALRLSLLTGLLSLLVVAGCSRHPPARQAVSLAETDNQAPEHWPQRNPDQSGNDDSKDPVERWTEELVAGGWEAKSARRVVELNEDWWTSIADDHPDLVRLQVVYLKKLLRAREVSSFLQRHPEGAGLLLSVSDPVALARLLDGPDYPVLAGLFVSHAAPADVVELTRALERHRDLIVRLNRRGLLGGETMFLSRKGKTHRSHAFEDWLHQEAEKRLAGSDEALASFFHFVLDSGPFLRDRLEDDPDFRDAFPDLWRKLCRVVGEGGARSPNHFGVWEQFLEEPGLWDVLGLRDGERLLTEWGPLAVQLLVGRTGFPERLRDRVVEVLLDGDSRAVESLLKFRREPLFLQLLERQLPRSTRIACLQSLLKMGPDASQELYRMERMTAEGLARHVGPPEEGVKTWLPLYSAYVIYEKWQDGRDISTMDWVLTAADIAATVAPAGQAIVATAGQAGKKVTAGQVAKVLKNQALAWATRTLTRQAASQLMPQQIIQRGTSQVLTDVQRQVRKLTGRVDPSASLDITRPVQFAFQRSGLSRETFQRLTGLDARMLLSSDASVRVHLLRKQTFEEVKKKAQWGDKVFQFFTRTSQLPADREIVRPEVREPAPRSVVLGTRTRFNPRDESWARTSRRGGCSRHAARANSWVGSNVGPICNRPRP